MSRGLNFVKYWLPAIVWMCVIFTASGDSQSLQHSSRIIEPILRWFFRHLSQETVDAIVFYVRKCAHLTEFAVLALFFWRALRKPVRRDPRPWSWPTALRALLCVVAYAASDEFHQLFVPSRQASVIDVLIDSTGAALGLLALWSAGKCIRLWGGAARCAQTSPRQTAR